MGWKTIEQRVNQVIHGCLGCSWPLMQSLVNSRLCLTVSEHRRENRMKLLGMCIGKKRMSRPAHARSLSVIAFVAVIFGAFCVGVSRR